MFLLCIPYIDLPNGVFVYLFQHGYIYSKAMPQLVLGVQDEHVSTCLGHPVKGHSSTRVEGFTVAMQRKANTASQQWIFTKEGNIVPQVSQKGGEHCATSVSERKGNIVPQMYQKGGKHCKVIIVKSHVL